MATPEKINFMKWPRINGVAATSTNIESCEMSMWQLDGYPGGGVAPTGWVNPDRTTAGALGQANPAGGLQRWLVNMLVSGMNIHAPLTLHDRLGHMGGLDGTLTTVQNVNGGADATISRTWSDPAGNPHVNNELWLECYSNIGSALTTATVNYKNENGVANVGTCQVGGSVVGYTCRLAQSMVKVQLASGDRGVSSVSSVQLAASTLGAGNFGVTIAHPILTLALGQYGPELFSGAIEGNLEVITDACLFFSALPSGNYTASLPMMSGSITFVDK